MKKTLLFLGLASVMLAFTGCVKDVVDAGGASEDKGSAPAVLVASVGGENETRTDLVDGKMVWIANDKIKVFSEDAVNTDYGVTYKLKSSFDGVKAGEFELVTTPSPALSAVNYFLGTDKCYVAVYPADQLSVQLPKWDPATEIGAEIPEWQEYFSGSYDPLAVPMMAVSRNVDDPMKFKFMGAMLRTSITSAHSEPITRLMLRALGSVTGSATQTHPIAGPIRAKFYGGDQSSYVTADNRDKIFTDMSSSMIYDETSKLAFNITGNSTQIVMESIAGQIQLSPTPTEFTFGILPGSHRSGLAIKCFLMDGSALEKKTAGGEIRSGQMIKLPAFELPVQPIMPEVFVNADESKIEFYGMESADVESYDLQVMVLDEVLTTTPVTLADGATGSMTYAELNFIMDKLVGFKISPGTTEDYDLVLRANFKSDKALYAAYSAPDYYTYTASLPAMQIRVTANWISENNPYMVNVDNAYIYTGLKIEGAFAEGTKQTADFTGAQYVTYDPEGFGWEITLPKFETIYTIAFRLVDTSGAQVGIFYQEFTTPAEPKAPALDITLTYQELTQWGQTYWAFTPSGVKEILKFYPAATWEIHFKHNPTSETDMEGAQVLEKGVDSYGAEEFEWNTIFDYAQTAANNGPYNVQVILKNGTDGFEFEGTKMTEVKTNIVQATYTHTEDPL